MSSHLFYSALCEIQDREIRKLEDNEVVIHVLGTLFLTNKFFSPIPSSKPQLTRKTSHGVYDKGALRKSKTISLSLERGNPANINNSSLVAAQAAVVAADTKPAEPEVLIIISFFFSFFYSLFFSFFPRKN